MTIETETCLLQSVMPFVGHLQLHQVHDGTLAPYVAKRLGEGRAGPRCVAWPAVEVAALNAARIAGKGEADIRALVTRLQAARALAQSV